MELIPKKYDVPENDWNTAVLKEMYEKLENEKWQNFFKDILQEDVFWELPASTRYHHSQKGGYVTHICEVLVSGSNWQYHLNSVKRWCEIAANYDSTTATPASAHS